MLDLIYIALTALIFALTALLARGLGSLDRTSRREERG